MKSLSFKLSLVVMALSTTMAFAQSDAQTPGAQMDHSQKPAAPKSEAQMSFQTMKALAGEWEGAVSTDMSEAMKKQMGADMKPLHVSMRVTSRGNVLVHEIQEAGTPLDPTKYDHPVTMLYVDADKLTLVHYCDAGNRPRMAARVSPDGKNVEFDLVDVSGGTQHGHMHHAVFTMIDANHHTEEWTYMMPGDKPIHARFDLQRTK
ncbi:MAG: hypothetical protein JWO20_3281 [Candidatus Angelobacter sp.]|jgi:hypothetical protein|nr:hypothetical protein [Candidatus Angelobacter sp.]